MSEYVFLGPICRDQLGMQAQYGCRYFKPGEVCSDLRFEGTTADYHSMKIHKDDVKTFVDRVMAFRRSNWEIA